MSFEVLHKPHINSSATLLSSSSLSTFPFKSLMMNALLKRSDAFQALDSYHAMRMALLKNQRLPLDLDNAELQRQIMEGKVQTRAPSR
jgi:hypothetical protein